VARAEAVLHTVQIVLAQIIVLIQHRDLRIGSGAEDMFREDVSFGPVAWIEGDRPGIVPRICEHAEAAGDEHLRNLVVIEVGTDRCVLRRPDASEYKRDLLLLN
jgi:hypothetical protein